MNLQKQICSSLSEVIDKLLAGEFGKGDEIDLDLLQSSLDDIMYEAGANSGTEEEGVEDLEEEDTDDDPDDDI